MPLELMSRGNAPAGSSINSVLSSALTLKVSAESARVRNIVSVRIRMQISPALS